MMKQCNKLTCYAFQSISIYLNERTDWCVDESVVTLYPNLNYLVIKSIGDCSSSLKGVFTIATSLGMY